MVWALSPGHTATPAPAAAALGMGCCCPAAKAVLAEIDAPGLAVALTDEQAAEMFGWLWITGVVHLVAGVMALP